MTDVEFTCWTAKSWQFIIFCKTCGIVDRLSRKDRMPYKFRCPSCGKEGKLFYCKKMLSFPMMNMGRLLTVASVFSDVGQELLKQDLILKHKNLNTTSKKSNL